MPRATQPLFRHAEYDSLRAASDERADCAVVAVAAATGATYATVKAIMAAFGRKANKGTAMEITRATLTHFGRSLRRVDPQHFISRYPGGHVRLRSVTTHHPDRFPRVWADGKTYLMRTRQHILCIKDGRNLDWTRGRAIRAHDILEVV